MRVGHKNNVWTVYQGSKLVMCLLAVLSAVFAGAAQQTKPVVRVDSGQLEGVVEDGVVSFKGIPYAAPPVGELRWRPPQPVAPWSGVRRATEFGANCMQGGFGPPQTGAGSGPAPSEDCLFLNVWSPESANSPWIKSTKHIESKMFWPDNRAWRSANADPGRQRCGWKPAGSRCAGSTPSTAG